MSAHMRKHPTEINNGVIQIHHAGVLYQIPRKIVEKYRVVQASAQKAVNSEEVFVNINKKYTKPGALLRGIRVRENLTQVQMAALLQMTQSDISQIENGTRKIGRKIAKRVEKLFAVNYRSFLE